MCSRPFYSRRRRDVGRPPESLWHRWWRGWRCGWRWTRSLTFPESRRCRWYAWCAWVLRGRLLTWLLLTLVYKFGRPTDPMYLSKNAKDVRLLCITSLSIRYRQTPFLRELKTASPHVRILLWSRTDSSPSTTWVYPENGHSSPDCSLKYAVLAISILRTTAKCLWRCRYRRPWSLSGSARKAVDDSNFCKVSTFFEECPKISVIFFR